MQLIGSPEYNSQGSIVLGTAEGGIKVTLFRVNAIDLNEIFIDADSPFPDTGAIPMDLNYWFFHTMHHEFCHILTQTKNYSTDFQTISAGDYQTTGWVNVDDEEAPQMGFVTGYASGEYNEDFAEIYSTYITHTEEAWQKILDYGIAYIYTYTDENGEPAKYTVPYEPLSDEDVAYYRQTYPDFTLSEIDRSGREAIEAKFDILKEYFLNSWGIDLDELREIVLRRAQEVKNLDLRTLN